MLPLLELIHMALSVSEKSVCTCVHVRACARACVCVCVCVCDVYIYCGGKLARTVKWGDSTQRLWGEEESQGDRAATSTQCGLRHLAMELGACGPQYPDTPTHHTSRMCAEKGVGSKNEPRCKL